MGIRWMRTLPMISLLVILGVSTLAIGCATLADPLRLDRSASKKPWWERENKQAVFVPGKGFSVEGVDGYFDELGRPMTGPVEGIASRAGETDRAVSIPFRDQGTSATFNPVERILQRPPDEPAARKLYAEANERFEKKRYKSAARKYKQAAGRWPDSTLEQDAMFMRAESLFFADLYPAANDACDALIERYPGTRHLNKAIARQFAMARYWQEIHQKHRRVPVIPNFTDKTRHRFDTMGHALKTYDNIRMNDPTGPLADDALMATANAYFLLSRFEDADYHYGLLRREYPKSPHQYEAHLLGLQSKLQRFQGVDYDDTVLDEADELIDQLATQFANRVGDERQRLEEIRGKIATHRALQTWTRAEFYAKTKQFGAARPYYEQIVQDHPNSKLADQARERLANYEVQPDSPTDQFAWLDYVFPESSTQHTTIARPLGSTTRR